MQNYPLNMATQFINLAQFHKPKTLNATGHKILHKRDKPLSSKSISRNTPSSTHHHDQHTIHHPLPDLTVTKYPFPPPSEDGHRAKDKKKAKRRGGNRYGEQWGGEVARISLWWYMKSSIRYILMKARAFYNEFSCDSTTAHDHDSKLAMHLVGGRHPMMVVDPYFSIPVLPPNI